MIFRLTYTRKSGLPTCVSWRVLVRWYSWPVLSPDCVKWYKLSNMLSRSKSLILFNRTWSLNCSRSNCGFSPILPLRQHALSHDYNLPYQYPSNLSPQCTIYPAYFWKWSLRIPNDTINSYECYLYKETADYSLHKERQQRLDFDCQDRLWRWICNKEEVNTTGHTYQRMVIRIGEVCPAEHFYDSESIQSIFSLHILVYWLGSQNAFSSYLAFTASGRSRWARSSFNLKNLACYTRVSADHVNTECKSGYYLHIVLS